VFVEEVNYDADKIKIAIDIIDQLKFKMDELAEDTNEEDSSIMINEEILREINKEYQYYQSQKLLQTKTIKESFQKILKQHEESYFFNLDKFLASKYANSTTSKLKCDYCDDFIAKNQSALSAHQRHCKLRIKPEENQVIDTITEEQKIKSKTQRKKKSEEVVMDKNL
jgi:hypothetical protein